MKTVAQWCVGVMCILALTGCAELLVGTAAGGALGASLGTRMDRSSGRGAGRDVGAAVVVSFSEPRDVHAVVMRDEGARRGVPSDSILVRAATTASGRIADNRKDSLVIVLSGTNGARGRMSFGGKHSIAVARDSTVKVTVLNRRPSRNTGLFLGALAGWFTTGYVLLLKNYPST